MYGAQDNDVVVGKNGNWDGDNLNSDGFGCIIHPTNSSIVYGSGQYGNINKSTDQGNNWFQLNVGNTDALWDSPYKMNYNNPNELFAGMDHMYHSTNGGSSWSQLGNLGSTTRLFKDFAFCAASPQNMYAVYGSNSNITSNSVYKSTNGGTTWSLLTAPEVTGYNLKGIEVHPTDPLRIWVTVGGYRVGKKVLYSDDGGVSFYNISGSLPNLSANTVVYQKGSNDIIYVGMDNGVYVYGDTLTDWVPYYTNLPNAIVKELKIRYKTNDLFAGTYGRGVWRTNLYQNAVGVGIKDVESSTKVIVYPNPVGDELVIDTKDAPEGEAQIQIMDAMGQLILETEMDEPRLTIPCSQLATGIYFVSYTIGGSKTVRRFVKL
jgi:hypothetical protein